MSQITIHDSECLPEKPMQKILLSPEDPNAKLLEILPLQKEETPAFTTGNEIMVRVAQACENLGYELLDDGIYFNDKRLVEIVYREGIPCFVQTLFHQQQVKSDSLDLLDKPFCELLLLEWRMLQEYEPMQDLAA